MPYEELLGWQDYFRQRPLGWQEDDRTMKLLQVQGVKAAPQEVFQSLAQMSAYNSNRESLERGRPSASGLKSSAFFAMMQKAVGGDSIGAAFD